MASAVRKTPSYVFSFYKKVQNIWNQEASKRTDGFIFTTFGNNIPDVIIGYFAYTSYSVTNHMHSYLP